MALPPVFARLDSAVRANASERSAPRVTWLSWAAVAGVVVLWMLWMPRSVLAGDDLALVLSFQHLNLHDALVHALTNNDANKYRPVLWLLFTVTVRTFGPNFTLYLVVNALIELASALTVLSIVNRLTRGNTLVAALSATAFVVSRFAYYNLTQIYGAMEGLALLFMLLAIRAVVIAYQGRDPRALAPTIWWGILMIFTDERYLSVVPFLVAAALLHPARREQRRTVVLLALGNCAGTVAYVALKTLVFKTVVATGTGGNELHPRLEDVWMFLKPAVANMAGFNAGPSFFSGRDVSDAGLLAYVLGALVCIPMVLVIAWYAVDVFQGRERRTPFLLGLLVFVPMLLTTTVTVRQEFRWLYAPFALAMLGFAAAGARRTSRRGAAALTAIALTASIAGGVYYRQFAPSVFFIHDMLVAAAVRDALEQSPNARVVLATGNDPGLKGWTFGNGAFFALNGLDASRVRYIGEPPEAANETGNFVLLAVSAGEAGAERVDVPAVPVVPFIGVRVSFESRFDTGIINSTRPTPTPGGRGVFLFPQPGEGKGMSSITVLPGFRYTFRNVRIVLNEHLRFYVAQPRAAGAPSRAFVSVRDAGGTADLFSAVLQPSISAPVWRPQDIPLDQFAGRTVDVTFGADPTTADRSAWVAFAEPSLVMAAP